MSLLMEALRKAEEAKSKTKKDESDKAGSEDSQSAAVDASTMESPVAPPTLNPAIDELDKMPSASESPQGPVVINPDPDEEETLASHISESSDDSPSLPAPAEETDEDDPLSDLLDDLEKIEFITESSKEENNTPETSPPAFAENETEDEDNDGLSLLQSSYFTRTKKAGRSSFIDPEPEDFEHTSEPNSDGITESETSTETKAANNTEIPDTTAITDEPDSGDLAESRADTPVHENTAPQDNVNDSAPAVKTKPAARKVQSKQDKLQERQKRDSAGSLFLAKQSSQKHKTRKVRALAAVLLIIPVAGISYWLYSSLYAPSGMQITMPAQGNQANRGEFLILDTPPAEGDEAVLSSASTHTPIEGESESNLTVASTTETPAALDADGLQVVERNPPQGINQTLPGQNLPGQTSAATNGLAGGTEGDETGIIAQQAASAQGTAATAQPSQVPQQQLVNQSNPAPANPPGLNFIKADAEDVLDPNLNAAYASYQQSDFDAAGRFYQLALNNEPNNRDAMLGLASVYLKQNNLAFSRNLYARLLELNPRDPLALAGLLDLSMRDDPAGQESELLSLTADYPRIAPLSFALGNLYASQNRWSEAQNSYFNALLAAKSADLGAISPDYAYNLAVSLERVNQLRAALDYYREAEELSRVVAPGFDLQVLAQRLNYLEQRVP